MRDICRGGAAPTWPRSTTTSATSSASTARSSQGAIDAMRGRTEAAARTGEGQPPEEQLRRFIGVFLHRVLHARAAKASTASSRAR